MRAMRLLGQQHVDVLFTDNVMPGRNDGELAKAAKWLQPDLNVMLVTAYYGRAAEAEGLGKLLFKPVRGPQTIEALSDLWALNRLRGVYPPWVTSSKGVAFLYARAQAVRPRADQYIQRIQKTLEEASIKLDSVITDVMGLPGRPP
jgi:CheY-like chemotaxis protein